MRKLEVQPKQRKSFLRWAGSKKKLLPKLTPHWEKNNYLRYVEPFMGSAAFFFSVEPRRALLADINQDLVDTFCAVKECPIEIHEALRTFPLGKDGYYKVRASNPNRYGEIRRAARFIFLNRFCFNGIYRTNNQGKFNVPYAESKTGALPTADVLVRASEVLKKADIRCMDFEKLVLSRVKKGDFVYLDPPFAVSNRRVFCQYGPQVFGLSDLERLRNVLIEIDRRGASFLVSYAYCKEAIVFLKGWTMRRTVTQRNIAGFVDHRRSAIEVLVTNIA